MIFSRICKQYLFTTLYRQSAFRLARRGLTGMASDTNLHRYQTHPLIVWVDCEMTGIEVNTDQLLEIAVILTDSDLTEIDSMGPLHIQTEKAKLDSMNAWCIKNHTKSGLVAACLNSELGIEEADARLSDLLKKHGIKRAALAGNSVSYDRLFLQKYCPKFRYVILFVHRKIIDCHIFR